MKPNQPESLGRIPSLGQSLVCKLVGKQLLVGTYTLKKKCKMLLCKTADYKFCVTLDRFGVKRQFLLYPSLV